MRLHFTIAAKSSPWLLLFPALLFPCLPARAQSEAVSSKPYAVLDRQSVVYRGPLSPTGAEQTDGPVAIGMILPLRGSQESEGKALLAAAQLAIEEEQAKGPLVDGRHLEIVARDETGLWGQVSTQILKLVEEDRAVAIFTSANGASAHLAEQIANKLSVPILTLASDPSTTQANVPWIFRLGPSDTDQARAFSQRIYTELHLQKVLLVAQMDHDGRTGAAEFEKAAKGLGATPPLRFEPTGSAGNLESFDELLQTNAPEAIVFWTDTPTADELLALTKKIRPTIPVFLSRKSVEFGTREVFLGNSFTIDSASAGQAAATSKFSELYRARTGTNPSLAADEIYLAVRMVAKEIRATGANRVMLRDYLANQEISRDPKTVKPFDPAGNDLRKLALVKMQTNSPAKP
ncbi:MAG: ABC transporter substrate-binding protein [Candidatus Acidiferrum sp.]